MKITTIQHKNNTYFKGQPTNYAIVSEIMSRSAQPKKNDFLWLKEQGITDIVNFRTNIIPNISFDEKTVVENMGLNYHSIPTITRFPSEKKVVQFLDLAERIKNNNGKLHIHCRAGADRTGLYAFVYKSMNNIGTTAENIKEWFALGHHYKIYPNLMNWAQELVEKLKALKITN